MAYKSKFKGAEIDTRLEKMVNVTYAELVALRDNGKLIAGQMYRMTDYETTCGWANTQCAGHPFDLVLTALDNKTLDEKCSAIWSERDTDGYFANSNLAAWDVRYCLDNDRGRFDWAQQKGKYLYANDGYDDYIGVLDGTIVIDGQTYFKWTYINYDSVLMTAVENPKQGDEIYVAYTGDEEEYWNAVVTQFREVEDGKGIIYRLTDEFMNSTPYDFKNIMFSRPLIDGNFDIVNGVDTFCYSFSFYNESSLKIEDQSIWGYGLYIGDGSKDVVSFGFDIVVGKFCSAISFGFNSSYCCIKDNCYNISIGERTSNVIIMNYCGDIDIKAWLSNISIGNNGYAVVVDGSGITIGNDCDGIYINNSSSLINIMDSCTNINIAKGSCNIYVGKLCSDITLEPSESDSSYVYYFNIIFMGENRNIVITNSDATVFQRFVQNIKIAIGLWGDSQPIVLDIKELDIPHMLTVAKNSAGDIKVYCEADLVQ